MAIEFRLPELGENIKAGDVVKVLVTAGDVIANDQPVLEMETDKAVMEVPSLVAGKVARVHIQPGDKVSVGQLILTLEGDASPVDPAPTQPEKMEPTKPAPVPVPVSEPPPAPVAVASISSAPVAAAPSARQLARELGVDIAQVPGSEPGGRISSEDVKRHAKQQLATRPMVSGSAAAVELPDFSKWGPVTREPMSNVRRKTAEQMALAWSTIPHVTQFDWADITDLEERRKKLAPKVEKSGAKLTVTAILIKIAAAALKIFPKFNASLDAAKNEIILKKYYHLGVAVDTERGLLVPVLRDVDRKNIIQIAAELSRQAEKARSGKVALEDLQGGSFTVTNLGGIGGSHFTPIIHLPEVAILGVGRARMEPSFLGKEGCCQPRLMLPLSLSYDHRLIDGADGARFLRWIVEATEEPLLIPLEG
jgi:pyruvate dehydrogenase E2 component (dihydrolipoamide acetyltransferase)